MYYKKGITTSQAHVDIPEGLCEEEFGRNGFFGNVSHLYRKEFPTGWTNIEGDLRPECLNVLSMQGVGENDYIAGRIPFLYNNDVTLSMSVLAQTPHYYFRNADGDECLFIHEGEGRIETDFGPLNYEKGDYLVLPRGTVYRLCPTALTKTLVIQSTDEIHLPDRGLLGPQALFDIDVVKVPTPDCDSLPQGEHQLKIKRLNKITTVTYPFNPISAVGWKGNLTVWQLNIRDIRPVTSERYHLPPSAHTTFMLGRKAVLCSFLPRPLENGDPGALKVPFYHSNIDFDEVLFYHDGDFFSRDGIDAGMITFHAQGIHHGPHPKAIEAAKSKTVTNEKAVMVDTRYPLQMTEQAKAVCNPDYWKSWM